MGSEVSEDVAVRVEFEELPTDFDGDDFGIGQFGWETSLSEGIPVTICDLLRLDAGKFVGYEAVGSNDKIVSVHRSVTSSCWCGNSL